MRQRSKLASPIMVAADPARPTSYDVARLAGVSQSAVSRCFSPGASIAAPTRAKVETAARSLGYQPNALARSLITRRSGLVGLVVTTATLRHSPQIVHDLSDALQKAGLQPLLTTLADERDLMERLPQLLNYQPEAIISLATVRREALLIARERAIPIVLVNRKAPKGLMTASVRCDHVSGVGALVQTLVTAGRRRFAFIAGPERAPVSDERWRGFERGLRGAGLTPIAVVHADYTYEGGAEAARLLLDRSSRPDAIICANDAMALGALDISRTEFGIDVPKELAITGFDDLPEAGRPPYMLTTVRQPTETMAQLAVEEVLRSRLATHDTPRQHLVAGTVKLRNSTSA